MLKTWLPGKLQLSNPPSPPHYRLNPLSERVMEVIAGPAAEKAGGKAAGGKEPPTFQGTTPPYALGEWAPSCPWGSGNTFRGECEPAGSREPCAVKGQTSNCCEADLNVTLPPWWVSKRWRACESVTEQLAKVQCSGPLRPQ